MKLILGKKFDEQPEIKEQNPVSKSAADGILKPAVEKAAIAGMVKAVPVAEIKQPVLPVRSVIGASPDSVSRSAVSKTVIADIAKAVSAAETKQPVLPADNLKTMQAEKVTGITPDEVLPARRQFLYEDIEKREQNGKHYVANDGTVTAIFQNQAVHFLDPSDNKFKDIDNSLRDIGDAFEAKANDFTIRLNKKLVQGKVFELTKKDYAVSLISRDAAAVRNNLKLEYSAIQDRIGNEISLKNVKGNTDFQYIVESDRVKENIIINNKADSYEYSFDLNIENMTAAMSNDGKTLELKSTKTGEAVFFIPAPSMTDAKGIYSDLVYFEIENQNEKTLNLKVVADARWLNANDRALPAVINPQIVSADTSLFTLQKLPDMASGINENMSVLTVKKSLLNFDSQKISKVTLKLQPNLGETLGGHHSFDITGMFVETNRDFDIEIKPDFTLRPPIKIPDFKKEEFIPIEPKPPLLIPEGETGGKGGLGTGGGGIVIPYPPIEPDVRLEVEYLTSDDSVPAKENFSLAGGVNGTLNLTTGEFVTGFTDASTKKSALACQISHVYKKNSTNYGCGKNWRLNLHQTLVKNTAANVGVDYIYTDSDGEKHGFIETYYYLNASNNKVTVDKKNVTVELDGTLWYKSGSASYEVFKDQRTATGMSLSAKMEGFKNAENLEQRQNELKQAEEYFDACKNNLKENASMNISGGTIYKELKNSFTGDILSAASFNTFVSDGSASGRMVLSKGEAMQYSSLLLQKKQIEDQIDSMNKQKTALNNNITSLNNNITSLNNNITSLNNNITSLGNNITSLGNNINSLGNNISSISVQLTALDHQYASLVTSRQALDDQNNDKNATVYQYTAQRTNLTSQINHISAQKSSLTTQRSDLTTQRSDLTKQRNDLTTQKNDLTTQKNDLTTQQSDLTKQKNDLTTQRNDIDKSISSANSQKTATEEQINYIKNKAADNLKELKRVFKEYTNKEFELKKLKEQTPVSYLSDGNASLCFNEAGKLCAIADKYNNSISIEYDHKGRISKVNDGKRAITLKYNFYGQLVSVTDYRGRRATYAYSSTSASGNLTKITYSDGNTLEFVYAGDTVTSIASSADKTKTLLSYSSNKLSKINNQSIARAIADDKITEQGKLEIRPLTGEELPSRLTADEVISMLAPITVSVTDISYTANECAITTDGKLSWYIMDRLGNLVGGYAKLTDGTHKERLSFNYFDRVNNWRYSVKETDDPIPLSRGSRILTIFEEAQSSARENTTRLPAGDSQIPKTFERVQAFTSANEVQTFLSAKDPQGAASAESLQISALSDKFKKDSPVFVLNNKSRTSITVPAASLPAGKTEFVFSAYAAAANAPVTDMRFGTAFRPLPSGGSDQKFEIVAEVNYKDKPAQTFVASFDYKNKDKQFCALPVTLDKSLLADLQSIVLKHVYTGSGAAAFTDFRFAPCEWEYKTFDQFKNVAYSETGTALLNKGESSNAYTKAFVNYSYDNDHRLIQKRLTNTTNAGSENTVNYAVSKYYYNDYGSIARTENYVEGEEGTIGIVVEETVYNEKGNVIKSLSYNTLNSTAKTYSENEYSENGQLKAEIDVTGENKTAFEYEPDTDAVQTIIKPDGGKFSYGRDYIAGKVTGITQSTESGEANSIETKFTCGVVTRLKSGLNTVNYEYDAKRRKTKVSLNGAEHVKYAYAEDTMSDKININDIEFDGVISDKVTATLKGGASPDIVTEAVTDKRGNLISTIVDGNVQFANSYDDSGILLKSADNITGSTFTSDYDDINKRSTMSSRSAGTKSGYEDLAAVSENYVYNDRGELSECTVSVNGTAAQTYLHSYKNDASRNLDFMTLPNNLIYKPQTDVNGRKTGKLLTDLSGNSKFGEYIDYRKVGDHTTGMVSSIKYGEVKGGEYVIGNGLNYKYDVCGNISEIWENGEIAVVYTYDKLQRLVREDNKSKGKSWFYSYDNNGNILSKKEADYTRKPADEITEYNYKKLYSYDGDKLTDCNGEKFVYDGFGNPTTYRNKTLMWQECKLADFNGITFAYDGYGQRVKKGNVVYTYNIGKKLLRQSNGTDTLEFIYDDSGLCGVKHGDTQYIYRKNLQGDITHIFDINGGLAASYNYDAWGNHTVSDSEGNPVTSENHIGNLNPFRYRGYLYDTETNLYFLVNRYYDPETGRFISQDKVSYLDPNTVNGLNLFIYCGNNPVMYVDETGCSLKSFFKKVWNGVKAVGKAIGTAVVGLAKTIGLVVAGVVMAVVGAAVALVGIALSGAAWLLNSRALASFSGKVFQVGVSLSMYGGFMTAAAFSSAIYNDMKAIGWNPFNSNEEAVLKSKYVSFYKGMPVIRKDGGRSGSFGIILLKRTEDGVKTGEVDENGYMAGSHTLRHEWGHGVQQWNMGPVAYGLNVGIPSWKEWGPWAADDRYYDAPWEMDADIFGGVPADSTVGGRYGDRNPANAAEGLEGLKFYGFGWLSFFF